MSEACLQDFGVVLQVNLQEQGRLLRQEEFLVFQGRRKMMRRVFLFEDLILFSKTRRGRQGQHDIYVYKHSFKVKKKKKIKKFTLHQIRNLYL